MERKEKWWNFTVEAGNGRNALLHEYNIRTIVLKAYDSEITRIQY